MTAADGDGGPRRKPHRLTAALLPGAAVAALFVGHPTLDLVARHAAFLDVHRLGPGGIVLLALLTTLVPAVAAAVLGVPLVNRLPRPVRLWLTFLAPSLVVVPAVFLLHPDVRSRLATPDAGEAARVDRPAPLVFLVLDELPLQVLLEENGRIDEERFPSFARLAATSHGFAGARSPYATTLPSVPAILTGRYADDELVAAEAETCNLFTDLAGTYRLDVEERVTRLARGIHRPGLVEAPSSPGRVIARDLAVVYLHRLLPAAFSRGLPPVDAAWGSFGLRRPEPDGSGIAAELDPRVADFLAFVDRLQPHDPSRPPLYFFHADLPHRPWTLGADSAEGPGLESQTRAVDGLLGRMLDEMESSDLLDPALLVVVADHGLGMTPGAGERGDPDRRIVFDQILSVPLFVKLPGQTEGRRHHGYVETVDVVPTLAEVLGFEPACPPDGRSLFAAERRWQETTFFRHRGWPSRMVSE